MPLTEGIFFAILTVLTELIQLHSIEVVRLIQINYRDPRPIYEQVKDGFRRLILKGVLKADERMPSVRELATNLAINPNTIQRAYRELEQEAYKLLDADELNFIGNIEARDVPLGGADVVVCDGYTGNIMIKSIEGTAIFMAHQLKAMFQKNLGTKIGYLLCKSGVNDFKKVLDSREVGGSMFLGVQKPVVKAHGSSDDYAMMNAIRQAKICVETGVCDAIAANMDKMTIPKTADEA